MNAKKAKGNNGFTIIELMIVVMIVAILLAIAYPSYTKYVRKANRGDAQQLLLNWSINQEIWRSNNAAYASIAQLTEPCQGSTTCKYDFTVSNIGANSFTLTATARSGSDQNNDVSRDNSISCATLTLDQNGQKLDPACWD